MFLPIGDDQDHDVVPWVNRGLLAANALVFVLACLPHPSPGVIADYALNPADLRPLQFLTHMFLHADLFHVAFNLVFLWTFGRLVEERLGSSGYAGLYLLSGLGSAGLHLLAERSPAPALGASGAVAGAIGAALVFCPRARVKVLYWFIFVGVAHVAVSLWALLWVASQVFFAALGRGSTAYWGHLGGFATGFATAWIVREFAARRLQARGKPLESRELRRPFQPAEDDDLVLLDESIDAFAVVYLDAPPSGAPRSGVLARGLPRAEADVRRRELGPAAALIADQSANHPAAPRPVDSASWDERGLRLRAGADVVPFPWSAARLVVEASVGAERVLDVYLSRTAAFRVAARLGVALTRVDPLRRQEEVSSFEALVKSFEERQGGPLPGGAFEDAGALADYAFRAWHLARAGRRVPRA